MYYKLCTGLAVLILISGALQVRSQCVMEPVLGSKIASRNVITTEIDTTEILQAFLDLVSLTRRDSFEILGTSPVLIHTNPGDDLCSFVSHGISLQALDRTINATHKAPVLTSSRIVGAQILVEGTNVSTLVPKIVFTSLLHTLNMEDHTSLTGSPSLVFIQDSSRRIITNFNPSLDNICHVEHDILNLGHVLQRLLTDLETEWKRLFMLNILLGAGGLHETFLQCCKITTMNFPQAVNCSRGQVFLLHERDISVQFRKTKEGKCQSGFVPSGRGGNHFIHCG